MRPVVDRARLQAFLAELSRAAREPTRLYLRVLFRGVEAELFRYPAVDVRSLRAALDRLGH